MVHAVVRLWAQDNAFGKRINAQLQGVQFASDGEAFGAAPFNAENYFDDTVNGIPAKAAETGDGPPNDDLAYRPSRTTTVKPSPVTGASSLNKLKVAFKSHPDFNKKFTREDVNRQLVARFNVDMDNLTAEQAETAFVHFDDIVEKASEIIDF